MTKFRVGDAVEWTDGNGGSVEILEIKGIMGNKVWFTNGCWLSEYEVNEKGLLVSRAKPAVEKRKVINICVNGDGYIIALCNDGTIWEEKPQRKWIRIADIPHDEEGEPGQ